MKRLEGYCQLAPQGRRRVVVLHKEVDLPNINFRQHTADSDPPEDGVEVSSASLYICAYSEIRKHFYLDFS